MKDQVRFIAHYILYNEFNHKDSVLQAHNQEHEVDHVPIECIIDPDIVFATMIVVLMTFENWIPFIISKVVLHGQACEDQLGAIRDDGDFTQDI